MLREHGYAWQSRPFGLVLGLISLCVADSCSIDGQLLEKPVSRQCCKAITAISSAFSGFQERGRLMLDEKVIREQCCNTQCRDAMMSSFPAASSICGAFENLQKGDACVVGERRQAVNLGACTPMTEWNIARVRNWADSYKFNGSAFEMQGVDGRALRSMNVNSLSSVPGLSQGQVQHILEAISVDSSDNLLSEPPCLDPCSVQFASKKPTDVYTSVIFDQLLDVDDQNYRFTVVFWLISTWMDDRVQFVPQATAGELAACPISSLCGGPCIAGRPCRMRLGLGYNKCCQDLWSPDFTFLNSISLDTSHETGQFMATNLSLGDVVIKVERMTGEFFSTMSFSEFPEDGQALDIHLLTRLYTSKEVNLIGDYVEAHSEKTLNESTHDVVKRMMGRDGSNFAFEPAPGWTVDRALISSWDYKSYAQFSDKNPWNLFSKASQNVNGTPVVSVVLVAKRLSFFYSTNIIVPVVLLNALNLLSFLLSPNQVEARLASCAIMVLALVAFRFVVDDALPQTGHATSLHAFLLYSTVFMVIAALEAVLVYLLYLRKRAIGCFAGKGEVREGGQEVEREDDLEVVVQSLRPLDLIFSLAYIVCYVMMIGYFFFNKNLWIFGLSVGLFGFFAIILIAVFVVKGRHQHGQGQPSDSKPRQDAQASKTRQRKTRQQATPRENIPQQGMPWGWKPVTSHQPQGEPEGSAGNGLDGGEQGLTTYFDGGEQGPRVRVLTPVKEASLEDSFSPPTSPPDHEISNQQIPSLSPSRPGLAAHASMQGQPSPPFARDDPIITSSSPSSPSQLANSNSSFQYLGPHSPPPAGRSPTPSPPARSKLPLDGAPDRATLQGMPSLGPNWPRAMSPRLASPPADSQLYSLPSTQIGTPPGLVLPTPGPSFLPPLPGGGSRRVMLPGLQDSGVDHEPAITPRDALDKPEGYHGFSNASLGSNWSGAGQGAAVVGADQRAQEMVPRGTNWGWSEGGVGAGGGQAQQLLWG